MSPDSWPVLLPLPKSNSILHTPTCSASCGYPGSPPTREGGSSNHQYISAVLREVTLHQSHWKQSGKRHKLKYSPYLGAWGWVVFVQTIFAATSAALTNEGCFAANALYLVRWIRNFRVVNHTVGPHPKQSRWTPIICSQKGQPMFYTILEHIPGHARIRFSRCCYRIVSSKASRGDWVPDPTTS